MLFAVPTLFAVLSIVFVLARVLPGDPAQTILGDQASQEALTAMRQRLGVDKPIGAQYVEFLVNALRGDWGSSLVTGYDWLDTVSHEFVHLVVSRKSHNTVPIWMHEGLAKYLESRWKGPAGKALTPSSLALLGSRVRKKQLVTFEQMSPSMALLPTARLFALAPGWV